MKIATLLLVTGCVAAGEARAQKTYISIDRPGALEAIERDNPAHYRKIVESLRIAQHASCETLPGILKVQLDIESAQCSAYMLRTSLPPKAYVSFTIDDVTYASNVVQHRLAPARRHRVEP